MPKKGEKISLDGIASDAKKRRKKKKTSGEKKNIGKEEKIPTSKEKKHILRWFILEYLKLVLNPLFDLGWNVRSV